LQDFFPVLLPAFLHHHGHAAFRDYAGHTSGVMPYTVSNNQDGTLANTG
jgi:hypothetical protein